MTEAELKAIEERANKATPGPISIFRDPASASHVLLCGPQKQILAKILFDFCDAEFFAFARSDIPALVAEVRRLKIENKRLQYQLDMDSKDLATVRRFGEALIKIRDMKYPEDDWDEPGMEATDIARAALAGKDRE